MDVAYNNNNNNNNKIIIALRQYQLLVSTRREEISTEYTHKNIATCICTYKNVPVKVELRNVCTFKLNTCIQESEICELLLFQVNLCTLD
jgi:hypothetical protein